MPTLTSLQAKRADLSASLEQYMALANRTNGAIAVLDDLIAEAREEDDRSPAVRSRDAFLEKRGLWSEYAESIPQWERDQLAPPSAAPEMLPILRDDEDGSR